MAEPVTPPAAASRRLLNATAVMASGTMISRVLGFLRAGLLVIVLGSASPQADAFSLSRPMAAWPRSMPPKAP